MKAEPMPKLRIIKGIPYASSLDISERFGVAHKNVLKAIDTRVRRLSLQPATEAFRSRHLLESEYLDAQKKPRKMYLVTEAGFSMCTFLFTTQRALEEQCKYIERFEAMKQELHEQALEKVKWRYADDQLLPFGEDVVRRSFPTSYAAQWLRHRNILPDMTTAKLNQMVKDGKLAGKFIPLKSIVYVDSLQGYLGDLGVLNEQISAEISAH
ncbi:MAG: Rha family transcriptional regulator [Pyrinomonadaceae bacterium]